MKKNFTLFSMAVIFLSLQVSAQSNRVALVEEATQASCPPCAPANIQIQAIVNANPDDLIFLGYQVWWPGFDPMYLDNPDEVDERVGDYYGFQFAPQVVLQGDFVGSEGGAGEFTQAEVDAVTSQMSEFDMELTAEIVDGILQVTGSVEATQAVSGDLKLRIVLAGHIITIEDAPGGTNGETEYHDVFKKFIPNPGGIDLADDWVVGDTYTIDETLNLATLNIYNYPELEVIAFVQNDDDKFVHQAVKDADLPITVQYANNGAAASVSDIPTVCSGSQTITPTVKIQNSGNNDLTSLEIVYSVNGSVAQTYNWTGDISTLGTEDVELDPITFEAVAAGGDNTIEVTVQNPNGSADESSSDDTVSASFETSDIESTNLVRVEILTDNYGEETSWDFRDGSGSVIASGDGYGDATQYVEEVDLGAVDCFTFTIYDSYGDGICCAWGNGNYKVVDDNTDQILFQGGQFDSEERTTFAVTTVGIEEQISENGFTVYPNPTSNNINVEFSSALGNNIVLEVLDLTGKVVERRTAVQHDSKIQIGMSNYQSGFYFVRVSSTEGTFTQRVTVQK